MSDNNPVKLKNSEIDKLILDLISAQAVIVEILKVILSITIIYIISSLSIFQILIVHVIY